MVHRIYPTLLTTDHTYINPTLHSWGAALNQTGSGFCGIPVQDNNDTKVRSRGCTTRLAKSSVSQEHAAIKEMCGLRVHSLNICKKGFPPFSA